LGKFSFWWAAIPAFIAASFTLANGPSYGMIIRANEEGRLGVFPTMLTIQSGVFLAIAAATYWITSSLA
jgi:hypothetical protein